MPGEEGWGPGARRCRCCGRAEVEVFHRVPDVPVHNSLLLDSAGEARSVATGDLVLGVCPSCGFIQNVAFDEALVSYGAGYEDTQAHSARFLDFAREVSQDLVERHGLRGVDAVEIGCGKGDFLRVFCQASGGGGVGYDPAAGPGALDGTGGAVNLRAEPYTAAVAEPAGVVLCRHTLEHVADVADFVAMVRASLGGRHPVVFFELPDTGRILADGAFWDLYYEHCSYFTAPTLAWLFRSRGFDVLDVRLGFDDQYLLLEARPGPGTDVPGPPHDHAAGVLDAARDFAARVGGQREAWRARILGRDREGGAVAIWGGSSKTVGFLAETGLAPAVSAVVDINPRKHGRFLPGSGLEVVGPDELVELRPSTVLVMNPVYLDEIRADLSARGLEPELVAA